MKWLAGILLLAGVIITIGWAMSHQRLPVTVFHETISIDDLDREYRLVVPNELLGPESETNQSPVPVVVALHGALDTTDEMAKYTGLDHLCAEKKFLLVYLQGRILNWQPAIPAENPDVMEPDLKFFEMVCDRMESKWRGDPNRIFVVGVSQGGSMVNVLAAKRSNRIAAAVCNCGWLPKPLGQTPLETDYKCPMLFISGTNDQQVSPKAVRFAHDAFEKDGHPVTFHSIEGAGHGWGKSHGVNELVWSFLSPQSQTRTQKQSLPD